ncbi:hypothetical protein DVH24_026488, partial [Malus domestica]
RQYDKKQYVRGDEGRDEDRRGENPTSKRKTGLINHTKDGCLINVDASWRQGESRGAVGVMIRDSSGRCLAVKMREVIVEFDFLPVITWLNESINKATWEAFPMLTRAFDIGASLHTCKWSWIPRSGNEAAYFVMSHQVLEMRNYVWASRSPYSFVRILNKDILPCPPS